MFWHAKAFRRQSADSFCACPTTSKKPSGAEAGAPPGTGRCPGELQSSFLNNRGRWREGGSTTTPPAQSRVKALLPVPGAPPALPPPGARSPRGAAGTLPGAPPAPGERTAARGRRVKQVWGLTKLNKLQKELARGVVHTSQACVSLSLTPSLP